MSDKPGGKCPHGISTSDPDAAACAYYADPEHLRIAGPGRRPYRRRPPVRWTYTPPECGPQTFTYQSGAWQEVPRKRDDA